MIRTTCIRLPQVMSLALLLLVTLTESTPLAAKTGKASDQFSAAFFPMGSVEESMTGVEAKLAIHWGGDPEARLSVWVDFNSDGNWDVAENLFENIVMAEKILALDVALPAEAALTPELQIRWLISQTNGTNREIISRIGKMNEEVLWARFEGDGEVGCEWDPGFQLQGMSSTVRASKVLDDGTGPALYVSGDFTSVDDVAARFLAKWDGESWASIGSDLNSGVSAFTVYDDGTGRALYVGGHFTRADGVTLNRIARWDGESWTSLGSGLDGPVRALAVHDDGSGQALYAAGEFSRAGDVPAHRIAKWDGATWAPVGAGLSGEVLTLEIHDDGDGMALFAAGPFFVASIDAYGIAKWDGKDWAAVGKGLFGLNRGLTVYDDGKGAALYAGGSVRVTEGEFIPNTVSKWDGVEWTAVGADFVGGSASTLTVYDDGEGAALYVGGSFPTVSGHVAKWDGSSWTSLGSGVDSYVNTMAVFDEGGVDNLYVGGFFRAAGEVMAHRIARWDGTEWSMPSGIVPSNGLDTYIRALTVFNDGDGDALYAGGCFRHAGRVRANGIAKWDGAEWTALGAGLTAGNSVSCVTTLATFNDGSGPALYAGGNFPTNVSVAKWDGQVWSPVGVDGPSSEVASLTVFNDGSGAALYAGYSSGVMKWDGIEWIHLPGPGSGVAALEVYDDGSGDALYAGGGFAMAGSNFPKRIAKWDGVTWSAVGDGFSDGAVYSLKVYDDGGGAALYAGGSFTNAGGVGAKKIAKWDGVAWTALGNGVGATVRTMEVFDNGKEQTLYVGGDFFSAGGTMANRLAKWNGTDWFALESGFNFTPVYALEVFGAGSIPALFVGGGSTTAGSFTSAHIAKYFCSFPPPELVVPPLTEVAADTIVPIPVSLKTIRLSLASTSFSLDYDQSCLDPDVNADGDLDLLTSDLSSDFTITSLFDSTDTDSEIDISITDFTAPLANLTEGELLAIDFKASCSGPPTIPIDVPIGFSLDPKPTFGDDQGRDVAGISSDGIVRIWPGLRGDCNGSGALGAADLGAIALEIFDDDDDIWSAAPGSDFIGSPVGCDANANKIIRVADIICTNRLIFDATCSAERIEVAPAISITTRVEPSSSLIWILVETLHMQDIGGLAFSLDLDPTYFDFAGVDTNGDGAPDNLHYAQGQPDLHIVRWDSNDPDGELDVLMVNLSDHSLSEGELIEIGIPIKNWIGQGIELSPSTSPSFGSTTGVDHDGAVRIHLELFGDNFETGDTERWSRVVK